MGGNARNPRQVHWKQRRRMREWFKRQNAPCAICKQPIDWNLPAGHPYAGELDEIIPISWFSTFEEKARAAVDPDNVQPAHRRESATRKQETSGRRDSSGRQSLCLKSRQAANGSYRLTACCT